MPGTRIYVDVKTGTWSHEKATFLSFEKSREVILDSSSVEGAARGLPFTSARPGAGAPAAPNRRAWGAPVQLAVAVVVVVAGARQRCAGGGGFQVGAGSLTVL